MTRTRTHHVVLRLDPTIYTLQYCRCIYIAIIEYIRRVVVLIFLQLSCQEGGGRSRGVILIIAV
ncbi:MAG: hypothetical protein ACI8RD_011080 [Bacillariaceae sp.]|jgi:hypothetical protein